MKQQPSPQKELHLQYIQTALHANRKEVAAIMWLSRISLEQIVKCLKNRKQDTNARQQD